MEDLHRSSSHYSAPAIDYKYGYRSTEESSFNDNSMEFDSFDRHDDHDLGQVDGLQRAEASSNINKRQEYKEKRRKMELVLLDFCEELYKERKELFKKLSSETQKELNKVVKDVDEAMTLKRMTGSSKASALSRSLSVGSPRSSTARSIDVQDDSPGKLGRFKIKTINVDVVQQDGKDKK